MRISENYSATLKVSYLAYIVQAIAINFTPLLFVTFGREYGISLSAISAMIMITFAIQLVVDIASAKIVSVIGYRACAVTAHFTAALGFVLLGFLPDIWPSPFWGIIISCFFYSLGSGLIEVIISPIVESCPTENKESSMALLHSFYSWGTVLVIVISTVFFKIFGIENWRTMSLLWALVPLFNAFMYMVVPINNIDEERGGGSLKDLFSNKIIFLFLLLMILAGASENAVGQWASAFAEKGLTVSKTVGDLAGPCMFALLMGVGRVIYSSVANKVDIMLYMLFSAIVCIAAYLLTSLSPNPTASLIGCGLVGLSVGVFWPGTYSYAASKCPSAGSAMFGILAFAGDLGCTMGPSLVGYVSEFFSDNMSIGILFGAVFPIILLFTAITVKLYLKKR